LLPRLSAASGSRNEQMFSALPRSGPRDDTRFLQTSTPVRLQMAIRSASAASSRCPTRCRTSVPARSRPMPSWPRNDCQRRLMSPSWTRPGCRAPTCRLAGDLRAKRAPKRPQLTSSTARSSMPWRVRLCVRGSRSLARRFLSGATDARGARGVSQGRGRKVGADLQGCPHQIGVGSAALSIRPAVLTSGTRPLR